MHIAMFLTGVWVSSYPNHNFCTDIIQEELDKEIEIFQYLKWGHLAAAVLQMFGMHMKVHRHHFVAKTTQCLQILTYLLPCLYQQYHMQVALHNDLDHGLSTLVRKYFFLEEYLFITQIISGVVFLVVSY